MIKLLNKSTTYMGAAFITMMMTSGSAFATAGQDFGDVATNMGTSLRNMPQLIAVISYIVGLLLGVLGILKIKDHVENPGNTPLKDGAIRLGAGGALLAIPMLYESMMTTFGDSANQTQTSADVLGATNGVGWD